MVFMDRDHAMVSTAVQEMATMHHDILFRILHLDVPPVWVACLFCWALFVVHAYDLRCRFW
jgi:hypothetical protein